MWFLDPWVLEVPALRHVPQEVFRRTCPSGPWLECFRAHAQSDSWRGELSFLQLSFLSIEQIQYIEYMIYSMYWMCYSTCRMFYSIYWTYSVLRKDGWRTDSCHPPWMIVSDCMQHDILGTACHVWCVTHDVGCIAHGPDHKDLKAERRINGIAEGIKQVPKTGGKTLLPERTVWRSGSMLFHVPGFWILTACVNMSKPDLILCIMRWHVDSFVCICLTHFGLSEHLSGLIPAFV